jgi:hypothetical protein
MPGRQGNLRRAILTVSTDWVIGTSRRFNRRSSALIKPISNAALWITSGASPMKSRNAVNDIPEDRVSGQEFLAQPVNGKCTGGHIALRIYVLMIRSRRSRYD